MGGAPKICLVYSSKKIDTDIFRNFLLRTGLPSSFDANHFGSEPN